MENLFPPPKPPKLLLDEGKVEAYRGSQIEGGKIGSFSVQAFVERSFIEAGRRDQDTFQFPAGATPKVAMPIRLRVIIYGADRKDRVALSPALGVVYSNGKQVQFIRQRTPVPFLPIAGSGVGVFEMPEPAASATSLPTSK